MKTKDYVIIAVLFYIGWFGSVFLAKSISSIATLFFPLILFGYLFFTDSISTNELKLSLGVSLVGIVFDYSLFELGFVDIVRDPHFNLPFWLISIWLLFAFSIVKMAKKFQLPLWLAALLGAIVGPLSYKSGEYFSVLSFTKPQTFLIFAIFWGITFPLVIDISKRTV